MERKQFMIMPCIAVLLFAIASVVPCTAQKATLPHRASYFDDRGDNGLFPLNDPVPSPGAQVIDFGSGGPSNLSETQLPSQVVLGWTITRVATSSVARTETRSDGARFEPMLIGSNPGLGFSLKW